MALMTFLPNDQGEPRVPLARSPATAGGVTAVLVDSSAWLAFFFSFFRHMQLAKKNATHIRALKPPKSIAELSLLCSTKLAGRTMAPRIASKITGGVNIHSILLSVFVR